MCAAPLLVALLGCFQSQERRVEARGEQVVAAMEGHAEQGAALREAAVAGELSEMKAAAAGLAATLPVGSLAPAARGQEVALGAALRRVQFAAEPGEGAAAVGAVARACGGCHDAVGQVVPAVGLQAPSGGPGAAAKMDVHRWAAERMWDGLVGPSDAAFRVGVEALSTAVLVPSGAAADSPIPPLATMLAVEVQDKAAFAGRTSDPDQRGRLFGELLGTCAACHAVLSRGAGTEVNRETPAAR